MEWLRKRDDKGKKTLIASPYGTSCFAISVSPPGSLESLEGIVLYLLYVIRIDVSILKPNKSKFFEVTEKILEWCFVQGQLKNASDELLSMINYKGPIHSRLQSNACSPIEADNGSGEIENQNP